MKLAVPCPVGGASFNRDPLGEAPQRYDPIN